MTYKGAKSLKEAKEKETDVVKQANDDRVRIEYIFWVSVPV